MSWAVFVNLFFAGKAQQHQPVPKPADPEVYADTSLPLGLLTLFVPQAQVSTRSAVTGRHDEPEQRNALKNLSGTARCNVVNMQDTLVLIQDSVNRDSNWTDIQAKLLGVFVAFGVLSFLLIYFLVPETKLAAAGKKSKRAINYISLEELNHIFKVPTMYFIRWQLTKVLPHQWKLLKYLLKMRLDMPHLEDIHQWYEDLRDNDDNGDAGNNEDDDEYVNDEDDGHQHHPSSASEMAEVQQVYHPGPDDDRRWPHQRQRRWRVGSPNHRSRQVSETGHNVAAPLELPRHRFQQSERPGSIQWEPSDHPSPDPSPHPPRSRAGAAEDEDSAAVSPPSSRGQEAVRVDGRHSPEDRPSQDTEAGPSETIADEFASRRPWRSESYVPPAPQVRRKPLPPSAQARDKERDYYWNDDRT